jgi:signal transduction histidine kinase
MLARVGAAPLALISIELLRPVSIQAPLLRAMLQTGIMLCALAGVWLLRAQLMHSRSVRDLLVMGALSILALLALTAYTLPVALQRRSSSPEAAAMLGAALFAFLFAAAALMPPGRRVGPEARWGAVALGVGVVSVALAELVGWLFHGELLADRAPVALGTATALVIAALGFGRDRSSSSERCEAPLMAAAATLLATAPISHLALPALAPGQVTPGDGLRLVGMALILTALLRREAERNRTERRAIAINERRRLARELHDGLAQDLAFIAAHSERMARDLGAEHPVTIAARRALAISRGAIVDLSAAEAPDTGQAIRQIADELGTRFEIGVDVVTEELPINASERDDMVRIVREAIVNAAAHGAARNVTVSLESEDERVALRIRDDGCGIGRDGMSAPIGYGLRSMHERAAALGAQLTARERLDGGTELELLMR